jgi:hypothetical protein
MSDRQQWTEYIRRMEAKKKGKQPRPPRAKKPPPGPTPAEMEAALDDLVTEAAASGIGRAKPQDKAASTSVAQK